MPNHVYNCLKITGDEKSLKDFKTENKGEEKVQPLSFEKLIPTPEESLSDKEIKKSMPAWYSFRVQNWGTKWDCYEIEEEHTKEYLLYKFLTAWSPPEAWLRGIAKKYPELSFQMCFEEEANNFPKGTYRIKGEKFKELKGCKIK